MSQRAFPIIETERLILNRLSKSDRKPLFAIFSDPNVIKHYDVERFKHIEEADRLVEYFDARFESDTGIRWAIRKKDSNEFIGTCGFTNWNEFDHSAVIGYELANNHWGNGYALEAVKSIINFIFDEKFHFYVHRIEALILPSNAPSEALVKKLGFTFEGALRGKCYWNGDFHDMNMFGLLRHDQI
ncbi:GNAT family protein [Aliiglaciecola litoralis]|uniref:GNAT family protein n=1 Tax=Aliiglaciecola litoralis TaxID=582857 RepID=A0ABN1LS04_9ALTE